MLSNVFIFLFFLFFLFSILGIQIFSGSIYNRCRLPPIYNTTLNRYISQIDFSINTLCSGIDASGLYTCPSNLKCVNFYDIPQAYNMTNITIANFSVDDERINMTNFINYGITNFDYITSAAMNVFSVLRFQNWVKLLEMVNILV